ncbi:aspartyl protease family protein [cf. Phormidesmis sp. LEGE 11477]|nr:aspartyl protease family protein [cf. Phormidesmis sp. LEGE 11477]
MGKVTATVTVTNNIDKILAERGFISSEEVRSITLENVLVDTGATTLSLPTAIAEKLGLAVKGETSVKTSAGLIKTRIFRETHLEISGRSSTFDCIELTEIDIPLLGVLPMEALGIEPDLRNQCLRLLPMDEDDTYFYAM